MFTSLLVSDGRKGKAKPLYSSERLNHHVDCGLDNCQHCGSINIRWTGDSEILHQAELPEVKAIITECMACQLRACILLYDTNNLAERDLRKLVIWRRKSYGTRSERGKNFVERVTSIAQTLKKQSRSILAFIQEAVVSFYSGYECPHSKAMGF